MIEPLSAQLHIWMSIGLIGVAVYLYVSERLNIERSSMVILALLLLGFSLVPMAPMAGFQKIDAALLLSGFANPALIAVLCLLIMGQGLVRTGALDWVVRFILRITGGNGYAAIALTFAAVLLSSPFINNTPVVIIFIPILESVALQHNISVSRIMMPLSFVAILAGMTTLMGSSTNLLISGALSQSGERALGFFDFAVPGLVLVGVGILYLAFIAPKLLKDRTSPIAQFTEGPHRRFIAQLTVTESSKLVGEDVRFDLLGIRGSRVILSQRDEQATAPPFDGLTVQPGDTLVVLATRDALAEAQTTYPHLHFAVSDEDLPADEEMRKARLRADQVLVEVLVAPGSDFIGHTLKDAGFHANFGCLVLGIERRAHVLRKAITDVRIREGDVLVLQGTEADLDQVRGHQGFVMMDASALSLPPRHLAELAGIIFAATVITAACGILPIAVAAFSGAVLMVLTHVLTLRQAFQAVDRRIFFLVGAALGLNAALTNTGGALFIAEGLIHALDGVGPVALLSGFFLVVAVMTNVLSNNATAVLFTPIAISLAHGLGVDPFPFVLAVLFGANCSFATPIGYQTNLLVLGPGHYTFSDFIRTGGPLVLVMWITFTLFVPWYYGF
ncbi:MAG: SLC13 family permease [Rhodospirillales bacterium]|jgi:di/tricarboxylate transporter|nr:SLC13 family permease [Rhodospirillales bacterium]MBT4006338.1 SLC13 family permease [Rhodospirillales bacterium]MBT5075483.1 SLC13 family permease [Rhodospirillales bacterium]MBT5114215.1 SLC13 family permease [Rhodospirillales bacterium]MBT5673085.1 SLC13 family permease [Rhodospirillales bacterium]